MSGSLYEIYKSDRDVVERFLEGRDRNGESQLVVRARRFIPGRFNLVSNKHYSPFSYSAYYTSDMRLVEDLERVHGEEGRGFNYRSLSLDSPTGKKIGSSLGVLSVEAV